MLEELEIRNLGPIHHAVLDFAPIRHALLDFAPGMTAITGETGAGKSMLLNAIRLISGAQADSGRISAGADETRAQGIFAVPDGSRAAAIAEDAGAPGEDGELFLTRSVPAKGRSRAMLNGHSVPRGVLAELAGELVTIHGQADQLRIASASRQREFLDAYAADADAFEAYRVAWQALKDMDAKLAKLHGQEAEARQRADYLKDAVARIDRVDPQPGEDTELKARRDRIENAAAIAQGVGGAVSALDSSQMDYDDGAEGVAQLLDRAVQSLRGIRLGGVFDEAADRLEAIGDEVSDVMLSLTREVDENEDGADLDAINERIHDLDELVKRWGPTLEDVLDWRRKAGLELEDLDASPEKIDELTRRRAALAEKAVKAAGRLHQARVRAAGELSRRVSDELADLAMSGAGLAITVTSRLGNAGADAPAAGAGTVRAADALEAHGGDDIAFLFTPFPGSPQLPMGKSASGGELSRLMLALELAAAERRGTAGTAGEARPGMTFIFDEVDAGVGGKAAVELGRRLATLARSAQVIVVTHLAQVASWADAQFVVSKAAAGADGGTGPAGAVSTAVQRAEGEDRVREVARMLSGSESETSLDHARELLAQSRLD